MEETEIFGSLKINAVSSCRLYYRDRIGIKANKLNNWLKHKYRQVRFILDDDNLRLALTSPIQEPLEGARYKVGDTVHAVTLTGNCRPFQICGIQSGGYSNVYTVIERLDMKAYCLKTSRALYESDRLQNEKLRREAQIWLSLGRHPNLVTAHTVYYIKNNLYILLEYVSGNTLSSKLKTGSLDLSATLKYAVCICRAMMYAKKILPGFVHGDIKPDNCLITEKDVLKLTDFGLARIDAQNRPDGNVSTSKTHQANSFIKHSNHKIGGTLPYMAPELFDSASAAIDSSLLLEVLRRARRIFSNDPTAVAQAVNPNSLNAKKELATYFIKHKMVSDEIKAFLTGNLLDERDKEQFVSRFIENKNFSLAYSIWASETNSSPLTTENNLIPNGDFETDIDANADNFGWKIGDDENIRVSLDQTNAFSGTIAIKMRFSGNSQPETAFLSHLLLAKPAQKHRLTFVARTQELTTGSPPVVSVVDAASQETLGQSSPIAVKTGEWQKYTIEFNTMKQTEAVIMRIHRLKCSSNQCPVFGTLWLDRMVLEKI